MYDLINDEQFNLINNLKEQLITMYEYLKRSLTFKYSARKIRRDGQVNSWIFFKEKNLWKH